MAKKKKEKEFTITIIQSDEPEHILEENYRKGMQYALSLLMNLEKHKGKNDNGVRN